MKPICSRFQHIGIPAAADSAVVKRGNSVRRYLDLNLFLLLTAQATRLCKVCQLPRRTAHTAHRLLHIQLYDLASAVPGSSVFHPAGEHKYSLGTASAHRDSAARYREFRVGKPIAKRIEHGILRKGLKISVTDIDVLLIDVLRLSAMIPVRRIVRDPSRDRVGQFSLEHLLSGQHIRYAVSALHATLPCVHDRPDMRAVLHKSHVDDVRDIQHHDHLFKMITYATKHLLFRHRQIITALRSDIVLILARCPSDHHDRLVGNSRRLCHKRLRHGHLLLAPRLACPAASAVVKRVRGDPLTIAVSQFLVEPDAAVPKPVRNVCRVRHIHRAAGTCPAPVVFLLTPSEHRDIVLRGKRQDVIFIFQENRPLRGCPSA